MSSHPVKNKRDGGLPPPLSVGRNLVTKSTPTTTTTTTTTTLARGSSHSIAAAVAVTTEGSSHIRHVGKAVLPNNGFAALAALSSSSLAAATTTETNQAAAAAAAAATTSGAAWRKKKRGQRRARSPLIVDDSAIVGRKRNHSHHKRNKRHKNDNNTHQQHHQQPGNAAVSYHYGDSLHFAGTAPPSIMSSSLSSHPLPPKMEDQALAAATRGMSSSQKKGGRPKKTQPPRLPDNGNSTTTTRVSVAKAATMMMSGGGLAAAAATAAAAAVDSIPNLGLQQVALPPPIPPVGQQLQLQQQTDDDDEEQQQQTLVDELAAGARVYGPVGSSSPPMAANSHSSNKASLSAIAAAAAVVAISSSSSYPEDGQNMNAADIILPDIRNRRGQPAAPLPPPPPQQQQQQQVGASSSSSSSINMILKASIQEEIVGGGALSSSHYPPPPRPVAESCADVAFQNLILLASSSPIQYGVSSAAASTREEQQQPPPRLMASVLDAAAPSPVVVANTGTLHRHQHHERAASDGSNINSSSASLDPTHSFDTATGVVAASAAQAADALNAPVAAMSHYDDAHRAAAVADADADAADSHVTADARRTPKKPAAIAAIDKNGNNEITISSLVCPVQPQDRDLISDRLYLLMQQFIPCTRHRNKDEHGATENMDEQGLCCKYCQGDADRGEPATGALFFRNSTAQWAHKQSRERMFRHMRNCTACPQDIRNTLRRIQDTVGKSGNITMFFKRILQRLHQSTNTERENGDGPIPSEVQREDINNEHSGNDKTGDGQYDRGAKEQRGYVCEDNHSNEESGGDETTARQYDEDDRTCLVMPEDRGLVSARVYLMLQQFIPSTKSLPDPRTGTTTRGIVCKHCVGDTKRAPGGRFFAQTAESLRSSHHHILKHVQTCQGCPTHIKDKICQLEGQDQVFQKGGRIVVYRRIIDRVHGKWTIPLASIARQSASGTKKALAPVARRAGSGHPIFTQKGDFLVSQVYNAWCHEIDQARAKKVSKAGRVRKIVSAVDRLSESIGFSVAEVLKEFDALQGERRFRFTTVADNIDQFKRIVKGRLTGSDPQWLSKSAMLKSSQTVVDEPKLLLENDPEEIYIEERAFLFHDPKESRTEAPNEELVADLKPLPPPRAYPTEADFPRGSAVVWKYLEEQRVLLADFSQVKEDRLTKDDIEFLAHMFERDDITTISQGLLDPARLEERLWNCNAIRTSVGYRMHHKFKRFQQVGGGEYVEMDGLLEMPIEQFLNYLDRREAALDGAADANLVISTPGQPRLELDVIKDVLYMIDLDLPRILPRTFDDFVSNFKMKEILPGGKWCMMNALPASARPFMGPNMYITPGGGFTQLHQDGHGTCDSGHLALSGYNEVVMLRRLPERHKANACKALSKDLAYDGMYGLPHDQAILPGWPTKDTIAYWKGMNYCPSVFILTAGQHVHINKGRLHAFRKLTPETLPIEDCHCELRRTMIEEKSLTNKLPTCVSIAWDWQFGGVHAEGIHRESIAILESALLVDKKDGCKCLAIPKASLLALGRQVILPESSGRSAHQQQQQSLIDNSIIGRGFDGDAKPSVIDNTSVARGILPALRFLVKSNVEVLTSAVGEGATSSDKENNMRRGKVTVADVSDCNINPLESTVEPDGDDYFCKLCYSELASLYFHCDGCEDHLRKDFNICVDCHQHEKWKRNYQMCPNDAQRKSTINHTGNMPFQRASTNRCPCKNEGLCTVCGFCTGCSCVCHSCFTLHRRYYDEDSLNEILRFVTEASGSEPPLPYTEYTDARLLSAADRKGAGLAAKRRLLADYPRNKEQSLRRLANGGDGNGVGGDGEDDASDASDVSRGDFGHEGGGEDSHDADSHEQQLDDRKMPAVEYGHQVDEADDMQDGEAELAEDDNDDQQEEEPAMNVEEEVQDIAILDSDAPSIYSSIMQSSSTSTTGSVNDAAAAEGAVDDNNRESSSSSIPKEIYAADAGSAVDSWVMEVEAAPCRRRSDEKSADKKKYYFY